MTFPRSRLRALVPITRPMATSLREPDVAAKWVDALYVEAMILADEARPYFDNQARDDRLALAPVDRVALSSSRSGSRPG